MALLRRQSQLLRQLAVARRPLVAVRPKPVEHRMALAPELPHGVVGWQAPRLGRVGVASHPRMASVALVEEPTFPFPERDILAVAYAASHGLIIPHIRLRYEERYR